MAPWMRGRARLSSVRGRPTRPADAGRPRAARSDAIRVLLIARSFAKGGAASGAANLEEALRAADLEVRRLDAGEAQARSWRRAARLVERVVERSLYDAEVHCLRLAPPAFDLRALVARHRPDVVQLCDVSGNVLRLADLAGVPCPVVHRMSDLWPYHGPGHYAVRPEAAPRSARWLMRRTVLAGACLPAARVAPSQWLADVLAGGDEGLVRVIRNAVAAPTIAARPQLQRGNVRFGFIARQLANPRKGLAALPPVLAALARTRRGVSLHLFGESGRGAVPRIPGVEVVAHGLFARSELARVFSEFDVLLCPSRIDNSPNVVSEALAHGRPVIAQSGTGMASYVDPTRGALLDFYDVPARVAEAFASACDSILADYAAVACRAAHFARTELAPEVIGRAYVRLYCALAGSRTNGTHRRDPAGAHESRLAELPG
jgi:glycosyltransferase involved in cell wall biosynthesis